MPTPTHVLTCLRKNLLATEVYEIGFNKPKSLTFKPGQFLLFDVPLVENASDVQTRSFSIASAPDEEEILIVAKMKEGGRASRWIEESLEPGIEAKVTGPLGLFTLKETQKDYLFICTSTGVAPFRAQAIAALKAGDTRRMDLIFGARMEHDLFWQEEFENLAKEYENFFVHFALSQPSDAWKSHRGRVQTLVPQIIRDLSNRSIYICGNPEMTGEVKKLCLETWGLEKKDVHVEGYI